MVKSAIRNIFFGVTVVVSAVVLLLWSYSYWRGSAYVWTDMQNEMPVAEFHGTGIVVAGGGIKFLREDFVTTDDVVADFLDSYVQWRWYHGDRNYRDWTVPNYPYMQSNDVSTAGALGFQFSDLNEDYPGLTRERWGFCVPFWIIFLLWAGYPLAMYSASLLRRQQEDRLAMGLCPGCGNSIDDDVVQCPTCEQKVPMPHLA